MSVIGRGVRLLGSGFVLASILGPIAAWFAKGRIVEVDAADADEITIAAIFEPLAFHSKAGSFRGGDVECWYGGGVIDLRDAVLDPAGARMKVRAIFGGAQLIVPEAWRVTSKVIGIGGVGDTRAKIDRPADAPHLAIEGLALFGGFAIASDISEAELRGLEQAVEQRARRPHRAPVGAPQVEPAV
jgi:hypothetical protein